MAFNWFLKLEEREHVQIEQGVVAETLSFQLRVVFAT